MFYHIQIQKPKDFGKVIAVVKLLRDYFYVDLKEAKDYFDNGFLVNDDENEFYLEKTPHQKYIQTSKEFWVNCLQSVGLEYKIVPWDQISDEQFNTENERIKRQKFVQDARKWVSKLTYQERAYLVYFGAMFPGDLDLK